MKTCVIIEKSNMQILLSRLFCI